MKITSQELITKFYNEVTKEKYPHIRKQQIFDIVQIPWQIMRVCIWKPFLPKFVMRNFGIFEPKIKRIAGNFLHIDRVLAEGLIDVPRYEYLREVLRNYITEYIKDLEKDIVKYGGRVKQSGPYKGERLIDDIALKVQIHRYKWHLKTQPINAEKYNTKERIELYYRELEIQAMVQQEVEVPNKKTYTGADTATTTFYEIKLLPKRYM